MKSIFLIPSLLSLIFIGSLPSPTAARLDPKDADSRDIAHDATKRRVNKYHRRDTPDIIGNWALGKFPGDFSNSVAVARSFGWTYTGCDVQDTSPTYEDIINGVADHIAIKGDQLCAPKEPTTTHCTRIAIDLPADIYFCGNPGITISCSQLADIIVGLAGECAERVSGEFRVRGTAALLPSGAQFDYEKVSFVTVVGPNDEISG